MDVTDAAIYDAIGEEVSRTQLRGELRGVKSLKDFVSGYWVSRDDGDFLVRLFATNEVGKKYRTVDNNHGVYELPESYLIGEFHRAGAQVVANVVERLQLKAERVLHDSREVSYRLVASQ